jgi:hypothetical protein
MARTLVLAVTLSALFSCTPEAAAPPAKAPVQHGELMVTDAQGRSAEEISAIFAPAVEPMHRCAPGSGGKINIRVERREGSLHLSVEPGASLDPTARECVLDALAVVELDETGANTGVTRPSGFTSILSVSW